MKSVKERILGLPQPITESLQDIGDRFGVSRQYVHQVVTGEGIPYIRQSKDGHRKRNRCKHCSVLVPEYNPERVYCDKCKPWRYDFLKKGEWFDCAWLECAKRVYRNKTEVGKMRPGGKVFCSMGHYTKHRRATIWIS